MNKKDIYLKTIHEYYESGLDELKKERNNSAVILFFKCLIAVSDLYIYKKTGESPILTLKTF